MLIQPPADFSPRRISRSARSGLQHSAFRDLHPRRRAAFTLVEMLLVLVILATLAAIVIPKMAGRSQQAKVTAALTQISSFKQALESYEVDTGAFPKGGNLNELVSSSVQGWKGPYLDRIPDDPWGSPYTYDYPGKHGTFDLMSPGPDMRAGTDDDITSWGNNK